MIQPGSFSNKIAMYLRKNETHSLHRPKRKKFPRRKIMTHYPGQIVQSDLIDMQQFSRVNSGFNYILVVIDCFSKFLWCIPLRTKTAKDTGSGLRSIFNSMKFPVQTIIFDQGLEYVNSVVQNLLKERGVYSYHILTKTKASSAERVIKTIKHIIWKIFTHNKNNRWIDILEDLTINYNNTYHKSIKMKPIEVTWENKKKVFKTLYPKKSFKVHCRLNKGDKVRIALNKNIFDKGFTQNWGKEIFEIVKVFQKHGVCWYRLKDKDGNINSKQKYFEQLNQV